MLNERQLGQNGQRPERCAISGRALNPEDIYFKINGRWLGVKPREWATLSPSEKAAMRTLWASEVPVAEAPAVPVAVTSPVYEDMSLDDLKALAKDRNVDTKGRKTVEDFAQALRVADVSERFASTLNAEPEAGLPLDMSTVKVN